MKGLIIYDNEGYARNNWFVDRLVEVFIDNGVEISTIIYDSVDNIPTDGVDFAMVRCINPAINKYLESKGIICYNNYKTSYMANNKYKTYEFARENNLPCMETYLMDNKSLCPLNYPFVAKSLDGHGGSEVFLVDNDDKMEYVKNYFESRQYIVQKLASTLGVDIRVYVLDGKILAMAKRSSNKDFRSNFSLGGSASLVDISKDISKYIDIVCAKLSPTYIGVDFIYDNDRLILNEIEDNVGSRMLYKMTDLDVHRLLAKTIIGKVKMSKK